MRLFFVLCVAALALTALALPAAADGLLVLSDGSSLAVDTMTLRGGRVEVRLPGSEQPIAYAVADVDLEASGLAPEQALTAFETPQKQVRGGFEAAIAAPPGDTETLTISDQDVAHVRRPQPGEEEEGDATAPAKTTALMVSNLQRRVTPGGPLTVTGTVTNSGDVAVTAIAITADAQDKGGESLGRGTTGISSTLNAGEAAEFSINIPVNDTVANVKVTAVAAMSEFSFEPVAAAQQAGNEAVDEDFTDEFAEALDQESEEDFETDWDAEPEEG
jgi:hypothetical protein